MCRVSNAPCVCLIDGYFRYQLSPFVSLCILNKQGSAFSYKFLHSLLKNVYADDAPHPLCMVDTDTNRNVLYKYGPVFMEFIGDLQNHDNICYHKNEHDVSDPSELSRKNIYITVVCGPKKHQ